MGSGIGRLANSVLLGDVDAVESAARFVREKGGEFVVEIPPRGPGFTPDDLRDLSDFWSRRFPVVPSCFYHSVARGYYHKDAPFTRSRVLEHPCMPHGDAMERVLRAERLFLPPVSVPQEAVERLFSLYMDDEEREVLGRPSTISLLCVVEAFVRGLREHRIVFNLRGSGGSSKTVRRIFGFPPPEPGVLFYRFASPWRLRMPDVDIDVSDQRRAMGILRDVCERWGLRVYRLASYHRAKQASIPFPSAAGCVIVPRGFVLPTIPADERETVIPVVLADPPGRRGAGRAETGCYPGQRVEISLAAFGCAGLQCDRCPHAHQQPSAPLSGRVWGDLHRRPAANPRAANGWRRGFWSVPNATGSGPVCPEFPEKAVWVVSVQFALAINCPTRGRGRIFLTQDSLLKYLASVAGWEEAYRTMKLIDGGNGGVARQYGVDDGCGKLLPLAHAVSYARECLLLHECFRTRQPKQMWCVLWKSLAEAKRADTRGLKPRGRNLIAGSNPASGTASGDVLRVNVRIGGAEL